MTGVVSTTSGAVYPPQTISVNPGTQALNGVLATSIITVGQVKRALIYNGVLQTVSDAVPADVTNAVNMEWYNGLSVKSGDALYSFIQSTLGYSASQMSALMSYAASQQV